MSIITISRGSHSRGKEVAEEVAASLGYSCVSRDVFLEASKTWNVPEIKLERAIHKAPLFLERISYGREKYIAYIQSAVLKRLQGDNVVYHGLAGHFFLKGVAHVLKVRIIADLEDRVRLIMKRESMARKDALRFLKKVDDERRNWSRHLYGIDTHDPSLYDLVVHIRKITVDDVVDIIRHTVQLDHFKTTPDSQRAMDDLVLAAEVKAALVELKPDVEVSARDGIVNVHTRAPESVEMGLFRKMKGVAEGIPGVKGFKAHILPLTPHRWDSPAQQEGPGARSPTDSA